MLGRYFKPLLLGTLAISLLAFFVLAFRPQPVPVDLATVIQGPMRVSIDEDGQTRIRDVFVVSAPVTGHLQRIQVEVGDPVIANQTVLARLSPTDPSFLDNRSQQQAEAAVRSAEAALGLAEAELRKARAQHEYARTDLIRARELAADHSISTSELDRFELAASTAAASLDTASAAVKVRQAELANARALILPVASDGSQDAQLALRAPVSGLILRRWQHSEAVVVAGTPLLEIGNPAELEIVVDLLSRDAVQVMDGAAVLISGWGGEKPLQGRVQRIEPFGFTKVSALGIEEQRVNIIIDLVAPHSHWQRLGHGFRVEASIEIWQQPQVLKVPTSALFRQGNDWAVFIVDKDIAKIRTVQIGRNNGQFAQVEGGLTAGNVVVLHPSERIEHGTRIRERAETGL